MGQNAQVMKKLAALLLVLAVLLGGVVLYQKRTASRAEAPALTVFCAAGLKKPVEAIAASTAAARFTTAWRKTSLPFICTTPVLWVEDGPPLT